MKSQMLTLILLIIGVFFFQPTHQDRLSKRELTEYDLISFIVSTCSADKTDMLIQGLCDQTFQSALMGNFPFLTYYCKTIGAEMRYCKNMNRHTIINQNDEAKRFVHHRPVRNLNGDKKLYQKEHELNIENDLEQKMIMQMCIKTEKSSVDMDKFCNRTLHEIQRGRYPEIKRFCKYHPGSDYCRHVRFYTLLLSWPLSESSSLLSSSSTDSIKHNNNPSFVSSSVFKPSDIKTIIDQQRINKQKQQIDV